MRSTRFLFILLIMFGLGACSGVAPESASVQKLKWVEHADPVMDAKVALERKDIRLMGVYGFALRIPGTKLSAQSAYEDKYKVRPIDGTSDAVESKEHQRLMALALSYAERYNRYILSHVP